jgi:hypothetical protein
MKLIQCKDPSGDLLINVEALEYVDLGLNHVTLHFPGGNLTSSNGELMAWLKKHSTPLPHPKTVDPERIDPLVAAAVFAMWKIYLSNPEKMKAVYGGRFAIRTSDVAEAIVALGFIKHMAPRNAGKLLREALGLTMLPRQNYGYAVLWDKEKMAALAKQYGVEYLEAK